MVRVAAGVPALAGAAMVKQAPVRVPAGDTEVAVDQVQDRVKGQAPAGVRAGDQAQVRVVAGDREVVAGLAPARVRVAVQAPAGVQAAAAEEGTGKEPP